MRAAVVALAALALLGVPTAADRAPAAATAKPLPPLRFGHRCVTAAERKRVVRFTASDRTRLIGVLFGAGPKGVVLAHQGGGGAGDLCGWVAYARRLAAAGYRVLAFDHRGRGFSGGARTVPNLHRVDLDAVAAIGVLRERGVTSVVLAGGSLGGAAVLTAAAQVIPRVQGVISLSSPQTYVRVDAVAAARRLSVPALFMAAEGDDGFADDARALHAAAASADKRLEIVPGVEHGVLLVRRPELRALVDEWIAAHTPERATAASSWQRIEPGGRNRVRARRALAAAELPLVPRLRREPLRPAAGGLLHAAGRRRPREGLGGRARGRPGRLVPKLPVTALR